MDRVKVSKGCQTCRKLRRIEISGSQLFINSAPTATGLMMMVMSMKINESIPSKNMRKKTANQNKIYYLGCEFELCILTQLFFVELELDLVVS